MPPPPVTNPLFAPPLCARPALEAPQPSPLITAMVMENKRYVYYYTQTQ